MFLAGFFKWLFPATTDSIPCPRCNLPLQGDPEGDMHCCQCNTSFKTDWDFAPHDPYTKRYFLTGESYYGLPPSYI